MRSSRALPVVLALALPLAALAEEPKKAPEDLGARIREATLRATKALAATEKASRETPTVRRARTLLALALLRAGGPDERRAAREILDLWWDDAAHGRIDPYTANYQLSLAISALEGLALERVEEPVPTTMPRYEKRPFPPGVKRRVLIATRILMEASLPTFQGQGRAWSYDIPEISQNASEPRPGTPPPFLPPKLGGTPPKSELPGREGCETPAVPPLVQHRWSIGGAKLEQGSGSYEGNDPPKTKPGNPGSPNVKSGNPGNPGSPNVKWGNEGPRRTPDNSNSQFSVLALHDASRAGVGVPDEFVCFFAFHFLECSQVQELPAGKTTTGPASSPAVRWGYKETGPGTEAMTFAGISSLAIAREMGLRDKRLRSTIDGGLVKLGELVSRCSRSAYSLYSLEKALDILEIAELDGKDWFPPLAEPVLAAQGTDGLWQNDPVETAFYVLFLTRGTLGKRRIVTPGSTEHRPTLTGPGESGGPGEVFLARTRRTVDAVELVRAYAAAEGAAVANARVDANEAVLALEAEGGGREACLLEPIAELLPRGGSKQETASSWLRNLSGKDMKPEEAKAAGERFLALARDARKPEALVLALEEAGLALPLRAYAAHALAAGPFPATALAVAGAAEKLALDQALFCTTAGARCARAYASALAGLVRAMLPVLPATGAIAPDDLRGIVTAARAALAKEVAASVERAIASYPEREADRAAWTQARSELEAGGDAALAALLAAASDAKRSAQAYSIMRSLTGELIPDDAPAWKAYIDSRRK